MAESKYGNPGQIEASALSVVSVLPYGGFKDWVSAYFRPAAVLKAEGGSGTLGSAAKNFAIYGLVLGLVMGLIGLLAALLVGGGSGLSAGLVAFVAMLVVFPILAVVGGLLSSALYFVFAKLFGGKGTFAAQTHMLSMIVGGMVLLLLPFQVLAVIPLVGMIFSLGSMLVSLYGIYSEYRMLKELHQLSTWKAIGVIIAPMVLVLIVAAIAIAILGAMFLTSLGGMAQPVPVA